MTEEKRNQSKKLDWFFEPVLSSGVGPGLISKVMRLVWTSREDLQEAFDIQTEEGLFHFYLWWLRHGRNEYGNIPVETIGRLKDYLDEPSDSIPQDCSGVITRRLYLLWCLRKELKKKYDLEKVEDRQGILNWWESSGCYEVNVLTGLETEGAQGLMEPETEEEKESQGSVSLMKATSSRYGTYRSGGVNIIGFALGELGLGEDVRTAARAMEVHKIPFCVYNAPINLESRAQDYRAQSHIVEEPIYKANIIFLPATDTLRIFLSAGPGPFLDRYTIGAWQWELPLVPQELCETYRLVDEIWASSSYTARAFTESSPVEVIHMRLAVEIETVPEGDRRSFSLPEESFLFLFVFDSLSRYARKNPMATIEAFQRAFPGGNSKVGLVIKCMNASQEHETWRLIMQARSRDNRIIAISETLPRNRLLGLFNCCDALVSLHRAEGFGRTIAEAMLLGKPVIVTNYSGNTDFTTEETAFLVDGPMVPVVEGEYPFGDGQYWCDPDVDEAAVQMKRCFEDRPLASKIARAGQALISQEYNVSAVGKAYRKRLSKLGIVL